MADYGLSKDGRPIVDKYPFQGLPLVIELKKGTYRYVEATQKSYYMYFDYGYVENSLGTDGEPVDVYVGPHRDSKFVFIVDQMKYPDFTEFDEQKVMLGFKTEWEARQAYLTQYEDDRFFGCINALSMDEFKSRLMSLYGGIIKSLIDNSLSATLIMNNTMSSSSDLNSLLSSIRRRNELLLDKAPCVEAQPNVGTARQANLVEPRMIPVRRINHYPSPVSFRESNND